MPTPTEHKTVQARILKYTGNSDWSIISREEAEQRPWFDPNAAPKDPAKYHSIILDDLLDTKVRKFIPHYAEAEDAFLDQFQHFHTHTNRIPMLVSECKNANWDETITLQLEFL